MSMLQRFPHDKMDNSTNFCRSNMDTPYPECLADGTQAFRSIRHQRMGNPKSLGDMSHNLYGINRVAPETQTVLPSPYLLQDVCYSDSYKRVS